MPSLDIPVQHVASHGQLGQVLVRSKDHDDCVSVCKRSLAWKQHALRDEVATCDTTGYTAVADLSFVHVHVHMQVQVQVQVHLQLQLRNVARCQPQSRR